jgi:cobalt-zinc-cadmium efflux system protein
VAAERSEVAHNHTPRAGNRTEARRLVLVLALTAAYTVAEVVGGLLSNSLALLADAGHMLTDIMALSLALLANWTARRPPDAARTYGYQRIEILAALLNGIALIVIAVFIVREAIERFGDPPEVDFRLMALVALGGLIVNVLAAALLRSQQHSLNLRAAYLHILGDLLGSIAALVTAGLIALYGWSWADPVTSALISLIIVYSAVHLVFESVNVLLEGAPAGIRPAEVQAFLQQLPGVSGVHDLHIWSLGGRTPLLSVHLVHDPEVRASELLRTATEALRERFNITHATLQVEPPDFNIISRIGDKN